MTSSKSAPLYPPLPLSPLTSTFFFSLPLPIHCLSHLLTLSLLFTPFLPHSLHLTPSLPPSVSLFMFQMKFSQCVGLPPRGRLCYGLSQVSVIHLRDNQRIIAPGSFLSVVLRVLAVTGIVLHTCGAVNYTYEWVPLAEDAVPRMLKVRSTSCHW